MMKTDDFDYTLPEELIAQTPLTVRSSSKLLICHRNDFDIIHTHFDKITDYLFEGDVLVLNDTKVLPARLIGSKEKTNATIELLLLREIGNDIWETLVKPARRIHQGTIVSFGDGLLKAKCIKEDEDGIRHFKMMYDGIFLEILD